MKPLPREDLEDVLEQLLPEWEAFRDKKIFITGGTGFFGHWIVESFLHANDKLGLNCTLTLLTRDPAGFSVASPHIAGHAAVSLLQGDVRTFPFPSGKHQYVIHGATTASAKLNDDDPLLMLDTIVAGTRHVLDFCVTCGCEKLLYISSGAVYGKQPPELTHIPEDYPCAPDPTDPASAYGEGKRMAELLCAIYARRHGFEVKIARCFAFVGPGLPLDTHFAIGNFMADVMAKRSIIIKGDGTPYRSYLYMSDLVVWLLQLLRHGKSLRAYNVGSDQAISIADLAMAVKEASGSPVEINILQAPDPCKPAARYVPAVDRITRELGMQQRVELLMAIQKTMNYHIYQQAGI